jgi:glycosyltransferase involved in cell wall biosynthesis
MNFPKVLIIGSYFNKKSGSGITMSNLFYGWDINNIAVASREINNPDYSVCNRIYQFGYLENNRRFPFTIYPWAEKVRSGEIVEGSISKDDLALYGNNNSKIKNAYIKFLKFSNLIHYKHNLVISREFLLWVREFSPDIIYTQLSSLELIRFVSKLEIELKIPLAIHIMDDWPLAIKHKGLFKKYWFKVFDKEFRQLLSKTKILMSISESMSEEYEKRYGYNFIPFHNPIDLEQWNKYSKKNYETSNPFIILYTGRIGTGILNCFCDIVNAVDKLVKKGYSIEFHLQSTNYDPILEELSAYNFVKIRPMVNYSDLPRVLAESDLLVLPNDFDEKSVSFLRYSMPTKASEYMISGTPVLLYSSSELAVTRHALKYKWASVVSEQNDEKLVTAILEIYSSMKLRMELGRTASEYAKSNFDSAKIRAQFRRIFLLN